MVTEAEIDVSVKGLFTAHFRLGMFDPKEMVKYANFLYTTVDSKENQALALEAGANQLSC